MSNDLMYDKNSILIAIVLFISMLAVNQLCYLLGKRFKSDDQHTEVKGQTAAIQAGIVGLLALLLGFTFNMSLQRYDARSNVVIEEAGAIGKAAMQANLLSAENKQTGLILLEAYLAVRISMSSVDLSDVIQRRELNRQVNVLQSQLMVLALDEINLSNQSSSAGLFYQTLSNMITVENKRAAMLRLHVPEPVLFLLFFVFVTAGGMLGYTSGLHRKRPAFPTLLLSGLIVIVVFMVIDLDRPKRGIIQVNQDSLTDTLIQVKGYQSVSI